MERFCELEQPEGSQAEPEIKDLELVRWVAEGDSMRGMSRRHGVRMEKDYGSFLETYDAICELGPITVSSSVVDVSFFALGGEFDGYILAVRQSGRNVRRFLIGREQFDSCFGTFRACCDHVLSNNVIDSKIELKHLENMAEKLSLSTKVDLDRDYDRLEIDIVAALQLLDLVGEGFADDQVTREIFDLGYCVGRLFSSAQNCATLEPDARKAQEYEKSYRERGKKGKSKDRKEQRLDHLFSHMARLVDENPALSRMKPVEVAKLAVSDATEENQELWSQGSGQLDNYLTLFASDDAFRIKYRQLFPKTG